MPCCFYFIDNQKRKPWKVSTGNQVMVNREIGNNFLKAENAFNLRSFLEQVKAGFDNENTYEGWYEEQYEKDFHTV